MTARTATDLKNNWSEWDPEEWKDDLIDSMVGPLDRLDFSSLDVAAANTDGGIIKAGTSASPITEDTADMKFVSMYFDNGATSGDNRAMYLRLNLTGDGTGGGEALRAFTWIDANLGTAHGAHLSLGFDDDAGGTECSGLGAAVRGTLHIPNVASWAPTGTYAAGMFEIYSDGANSDPAGMTKLSILRLCNSGNATGAADVDDDADLMEIVGWTSATGNMYYGHTLRLDIGGTNYYLFLSDDENRLDLSTINVDAANTDGGIIKAGTSSSRVVEDTPNMKFISLYFDNGATSGDNRGIYNRLYLTGAGGGGESLRSFTTVEDVAGGTAHGAHLSLNFGSTGSITGLGVASRNTLHVPDAALSGGTYAATQSEIWSDGSSSDISGATMYSFHRYVAGGDSTGIANVDDNANLFEITGGSIASGNLVQTETDETKFSHKIRINAHGTTLYLMACAT